MLPLLIFIIAPANSDCIFTQNCTLSPHTCSTPFSTPPRASFPIDYPGPYACPLFLGQNVCCSHNQNLSLKSKNLLIDRTFGHLAGGCDICAANLKLLWCYFTCSPNQDKFVSAGKQVKVPSLISSNQDIEVLLLNFTVTKELSCSLYESCKKCPNITEISAMQSPEGFLQFQGYEGMPIDLTWTTFYFSESDNALSLKLAPCNLDTASLHGYSVAPCKCSNCEKSCAEDYYLSAPGVLDGFRWVIVLVVYAVLAFVSSLCVLGRLWLKY